MKSDSFNIKIQFGILLFSLLTINGATAQGVLYNIIEYPVIPKVYCEMNKKVNETSGLLLFDRGIWTFNDSGGKPELYRIEKESGKISQKITLENGENYDWEDITGDEEYIYIGDFGNNKGNRKDLKIYKIAKKHIGSKKKTKVRAEIINFSYNDQESFVVNNRKNNYDCESVISFGDSLIIFSKNWVNEKTRMYKLPKTPGMYDLSTTVPLYFCLLTSMAGISMEAMFTVSISLV
ncbi:MAG: hypothetical protein B6D61_04215 [Bacteroidetes bacterium 4484_249]|nr:MAG: hypothetical protein B6D61_04215 [Bacteroidetes bacterium 4484_249]